MLVLLAASEQSLAILRRGFARPVEVVVLDHEDQVEENTYISKKKLGKVAADTTPVALQARIDQELCDGKDATKKIADNLPYAPADRRFPLIVDQHLGNVLDDRDNELCIAHGVDLLE
jgi:hypothetical protein